MVVQDLEFGFKGGGFVWLAEYDVESPPDGGMNFVGAKIADIYENIASDSWSMNNIRIPIDSQVEYQGVISCDSSQSGRGSNSLVLWLVASYSLMWEVQLGSWSMIA